MLNAVNLLNW